MRRVKRGERHYRAVNLKYGEVRSTGVVWIISGVRVRVLTVDGLISFFFRSSVSRADLRHEQMLLGHALPLEPAALNKADESKLKLAVYQSGDKTLFLLVSKHVL